MKSRDQKHLHFYLQVIIDNARLDRATGKSALLQLIHSSWAKKEKKKKSAGLNS